jgi:hypothetical protein
MMGNEHLFASLRPLVKEIWLANGASIYSKGEGEVVFSCGLMENSASIP